MIFFLWIVWNYTVKKKEKKIDTLVETVRDFSRKNEWKLEQNTVSCK